MEYCLFFLPISCIDEPVDLLMFWRVRPPCKIFSSEFSYDLSELKVCTLKCHFHVWRLYLVLPEPLFQSEPDESWHCHVGIRLCHQKREREKHPIIIMGTTCSYSVSWPCFFEAHDVTPWQKPQIIILASGAWMGGTGRDEHLRFLLP